MKKKILIVLVILLSLVGCSNKPKEDNGKLNVAVSFYIMEEFTNRIGGDKVTINNLVGSGDAHHWEPTPKDIVSLEKADLLIMNGAGFEGWLPDVLSALKTDKLTVIDTSKDIQLLESSHEHEHEHEHGDFDPHTWLSPKNALKQLNVIKDALVSKDPNNKDYYEENFNTARIEFEDLHKSFQETLNNTKRKDIVVAHAAFGYLVNEYGLTQVAVEGLTPDSEPAPSRISEIIKFVKEHDIKIIFFDSPANPKVAETIAKEVGVKASLLSPIESLTSQQESNRENYITIMKDNLEALKEALN